jgi:hypothetical protein
MHGPYKVGLGSTSTAIKAAHVAHKGVHAAEHVLLGIPVATGAMALLSQWEHNAEMDRIKKEYGTEIAGLTGETADHLTEKDVEKAAKLNPVISEAVKHSKTRRNISVAVTLIGAAATVAAIPFMPHLALAALTLKGLAIAAGSSVAFMALEHGLTKLGEKMFHLEEPDFKDVKKGKAKQSDLSVSSQVTYLASKQGKGEAINREQVMTLFASANPGLDAQIKARYGAGFAQLDEGGKEAAMHQFGDAFGLDRWTRDLNNHTARAQQLAFAAVGQASSSAEAARTSNRMSFTSAQISGAIPGYVPPEETSQWQQRIRQERQRQTTVIAQQMA